MNKVVSAVVAVLLLGGNVHARQNIAGVIDPGVPSLVELYKKLHAGPELSTQEAKTSAILAGELRALGFEVTERIGKYDDPKLTGYGVAAVMKNGSGPVVLVRADMDALPIEEKTGLPYASKVRAKNVNGDDVAVMHACGHDIHVTCLIGAARALVRLKDRWSGTLVLVGQPAEEGAAGARAMLNDGFYARFPKPDFIVGLHDSADLPTGTVGYTEGYALANVDTVDITIRGISGHGSAPETAKDPIVMAAQTILALQTIVSRESSPLDPVVVTVGSIHGGTRPNIIPDQVKLELTVRTYKEEVRRSVLASIERIVKGIALAAGVPADRAPVIGIAPIPTKATYNDPALTQRLISVIKAELGEANVVPQPPAMAGEDVGLFGLEGHQIPLFFFRLGAIDPEVVRKSREGGQSLPSLHSSGFAPVPEPTIRTGVRAMTACVLDLMKK